MIAASTAASSVMACAPLVQWVDKMTGTNFSVYPMSGVYVTPSGSRYDVSITGPTPLSVYEGPGGLCLQFWAPKVIGDDPVGRFQKRSGLRRLHGQTCDNRTFGDLGWSAIWSSKVQDRIRIYPPPNPSGGNVEPMQLSLQKVR